MEQADPAGVREQTQEPVEDWPPDTDREDDKVSLFDSSGLLVRIRRLGTML